MTDEKQLPFDSDVSLSSILHSHKKYMPLLRAMYSIAQFSHQHPRDYTQEIALKAIKDANEAIETDPDFEVAEESKPDSRCKCGAGEACPVDHEFTEMCKRDRQAPVTKDLLDRTTRIIAADIEELRKQIKELKDRSFALFNPGGQPESDRKHDLQ